MIQGKQMKCPIQGDRTMRVIKKSHRGISVPGLGFKLFFLDSFYPKHRLSEEGNVLWESSTHTSSGSYWQQINGDDKETCVHGLSKNSSLENTGLQTLRRLNI